MLLKVFLVVFKPIDLEVVMQIECSAGTVDDCLQISFLPFAQIRRIRIFASKFFDFK